jgi:uncharacterized protein YcbK (DUF882 family)
VYWARMRSLSFFAVAVCLATCPSAHADVLHVVQPGHTLEAIAHRYHVSEQAIVEANHLKDTDRLTPGQTLVIPGVAPSGKKTKMAGTDEVSHSPMPGLARTGLAQTMEPQQPHGRAPRGFVQLVHAGEEARVRVKGIHGQIPSTALETFERMMRQGSATHTPDPRLVALIGVVSDHFGGKPIEVVSGYRTYTPAQYTPHSNHNYGKALDFRIAGVNDTALYEFCQTLRKVGCGYYPNSTFVHLDVRDFNAHWVDRSRPGDPPLYDRPEVPADEGRSDVRDDHETPAGSARVLPPAAGEQSSPGSSDPAPAPSASPQPADGELSL